MNTLEAESKVVKKHRDICNLRAYDYYLRREVCTRVYTTVYLRVHKSVLTCTLPRPKYPPRRGHACSPRG